MSDRGRSLGGRVGRGLGWSTASNLVLRMGNLLVSVVMARLIAPEQFGVFAVALTVWTILSSLAEFGLGADLVRAPDILRRIPTVATLGVAISSVLAVGMVLAAAPLAAAFDSADSAGVIRLMSLSLVIMGFGIVPAAILQREIRQGAIFAISATSMVVSAGTMTVLALMGFGPAALAWGQLIAQTITVLAQYIAARVRPRFGFDRGIARESVAFCLPLALANLVSWLLLSIDNVMVARTLGPTQLGLYVLAFNVSSWPMNAIGQSIRVVALPVLSHLASVEARNRALVKVSGVIWSLALLMGVLLATLATPVINLLYGPQWMGAAIALTGLAAFGALRIVFDFAATFLVAAGATRSVLTIQLIWLTVLIPGMYIGLKEFGLLGAGLAHVVVGLVVVLPAYLLCMRMAGVHVLKFLQQWILPTVAVVPAAITCGWIGVTVENPLLALAAGGLVSIVMYVLPLGKWIVHKVKDLKEFESSASTTKPTITPALP